MFLNLRVFAMTATLVFAASAVASANTMELTLTVPLKITLPATPGGSPAVTSNGSAAGNMTLKPFDVYCAVGSNLGYATGVGAQGTVVGTGSTLTSGSKAVTGPDGRISSTPTATVIITYDDGTSGNGLPPAPGKAVNAYLCWLQWKDPLPSVPPIFVQGPLAVK
jgi:hypothetical protein